MKHSVTISCEMRRLASALASKRYNKYVGVNKRSFFTLHTGLSGNYRAVLLNRIFYGWVQGHRVRSHPVSSHGSRVTCISCCFSKMPFFLSNHFLCEFAEVSLGVIIDTQADSSHVIYVCSFFILNNSCIYVYFNTHTRFITPDLSQTEAIGCPGGILPDIRTPDHLPDT